VSPKTLRNLVLAVVIIIIGLAATVVLVKMSKKPARKAPPRTKPLVTAFTVSAKLEPVRIKSFGSVKAKRSVTIVPQLNGEVLSKSDAFEPGGFFTKGEVLLSIDDTDYVLAFETARANVAQAEYNLARAQEEAAVAQREWQRIGSNGLGGEQTKPTALVMHEPQMKLAEASLAAAVAAQNQAQVNLDRCTISAPFDGRVLAADVDAGQYLRAGSTVGSVYATDIAEITVTVPDEDVAWITVGEDAEGNRIPVDISAEFAGNRHHWRGYAVRIGGAVDTRSRLVPVVIEIPSPYKSTGTRPALVEGMFVEVTFSTKPETGSVTIPRGALRPGNEVWVINKDGKVDIRQVSVSRAGVEYAVISDGMQPGDRICTSNLQYVTQNMMVRVEGDPAPALMTASPEQGQSKDGDK